MRLIVQRRKESGSSFILESTQRRISCLGGIIFLFLYFQSQLLKTYLDSPEIISDKTSMHQPMVRANKSDLSPITFHTLPNFAQNDESPNNSLKVVAAPNSKRDNELYGNVEAHRKWAYAFVIGGVTKERPAYRGFLYNVVVAAQRLKASGTKADIVMMVQMSVHGSDTSLPEDGYEILKKAGIRVKYIPKMSHPDHEVFYSLMLEKFRILDLTEYSRVLFLDGDVMPNCNMDYIFKASDPESGTPLLKENVILGWRSEPAQGGFFMLKPNKDDFRWIQQIIQTREKKALNMSFPYWDEVEGWGHPIQSPDLWRTTSGLTGTNWTWHGSFADQGLLYHWTKYAKKSVSIILGREIENWGMKDSNAFLERTIKTPIGSPLTNQTCPAAFVAQPPPYGHFVHFTGRSKPWEWGRDTAFREWRRNESVPTNLTKPTREWYLTIDMVEKTFNVSFDFSFASEDDYRPTVGRFPTAREMHDHIQRRARNNWTHYQS